jgi:hypothetical protein
MLRGTVPDAKATRAPAFTAQPFAICIQTSDVAVKPSRFAVAAGSVTATEASLLASGLAPAQAAVMTGYPA